MHIVLEVATAMDATDNGPAWASFHGYTGRSHTRARAVQRLQERLPKTPGTSVGQAGHRRNLALSGAWCWSGSTGSAWGGLDARLSTIGEPMAFRRRTQDACRAYKSWPAYPATATNVDKRKSVATMLLDEEWVKWSDQEIARRCGVSHVMVGAVRLEMVASGNAYQIEDRRANR